uniref:Homing endonuclease LAGLIDADG domain-containing protein n=1 Tax=Pedinomonas tuberculata TaxID=160064 RepID=Q8WKZ3_9CHLO|nr:putative protein [Pedinomonas tuberculata]
MNLEAQWIVGFVDGEGCFHIAINSNQEMKLGVQVLAEFVVVQHESDRQILEALKAFWGCGVVRKNNKDCLCYRVRDLEQLKTRIVPFFEKHKLKTRKRIDFDTFRDVIALMDQQAHLTLEGVEKINQIRKTMNRKGISKIESSSS